MMGPILCAVDRSDRAPDVVRAAQRLASATNRPLEVLRVVELPPDLPDEFLRCARPEAEHRLIHHAKQEVEALLGDGPGTALCEQGPVWETICSVAARQNASLVVLGGHPYGALDRVVGTTLSRIVHHAPCDVLIVREAISLLPLRRIVVGIDLTPRCEEVLETAAGLAARLGDACQLSLVHVPTFPPERGGSLVEGLPIQAALAQHGREALARFSRKLPAGLVDHVQVTRGKPWRVLTHAADVENASLLVIGTHEMDLFDEIWGTTSSRIADRSRSSVYVANHRRAEAATEAVPRPIRAALA